MLNENTPTDNIVAERFMSTFKSPMIDGKVIEQELQEIIIENVISRTKIYKNIINYFLLKQLVAITDDNAKQNNFNSS